MADTISPLVAQTITHRIATLEHALGLELASIDSPPAGAAAIKPTGSEVDKQILGASAGAIAISSISLVQQQLLQIVQTLEPFVPSTVTLPKNISQINIASVVFTLNLSFLHFFRQYLSNTNDPEAESNANAVRDYMIKSFGPSSGLKIEEILSFSSRFAGSNVSDSGFQTMSDLLPYTEKVVAHLGLINSLSENLDKPNPLLQSMFESKYASESKDPSETVESFIAQRMLRLEDRVYRLSIRQAQFQEQLDLTMKSYLDAVDTLNQQFIALVAHLPDP